MDLPDTNPPELPDDADDQAVRHDEESIPGDVEEILRQFAEEGRVGEAPGLENAREPEPPYHPSGRDDFADPAPWPEPVRAGELLARITHAIAFHVPMERHLALTAALWAMHTHRVAEATRTPRLVIHSGRVACGKTTLLSVLSCLVLRPLTICAATPDSLLEAVIRRPTLLIDDGAALLQASRDARILIRNGCCRSGARLLRMGRRSRGPSGLQAIELFTAVAIAVDGDIPAIFAGRAIGIPLEPLPFGEAPGPLSPEAIDNLSEMGRMIARWASDEDDLSAAALAKADLSAVAHGAKADPNWRPLLAIAAAIGDEWSTRTTEAMKRVGGVSATSELERLLSDIRTAIQDIRAGRCVFTGPDRKPIGDYDRIRTIDLIEQLCLAESSRWSEHGRNGQPITPHALARILGGADIRPGMIRFHTGDENGQGVSFRDRGYLFTQFNQAFARYLPIGAL